jgi:putative ABC transport system substrate-binding protein
MRRRDFITLLGGATVAWPLAAQAQQGDRVRRIGVLMPFDENDPLAKTFVSGFTQALADLGWIDGRNMRMDLRWHGGDADRIRALAQELVGLQPDIMVTNGVEATTAIQREYAYDPDRLCERGRSRHQRPRRAAQPAGREHHWLR